MNLWLEYDRQIQNAYDDAIDSDSCKYHHSKASEAFTAAKSS